MLRNGGAFIVLSDATVLATLRLSFQELPGIAEMNPCLAGGLLGQARLQHLVCAQKPLRMRSNSMSQTFGRATWLPGPTYRIDHNEAEIHPQGPWRTWILIDNIPTASMTRRCFSAAVDEWFSG